MEQKIRLESDSVGTLRIPAEVYYGVQTLRGYENFRITGALMNWQFIKNIVKIKKVAAKVNGEYGYIPQDVAQAIMTACDEVLADKFKEDFITDAIQGGAGTTVNMNANEVLANRASELLGGKKREDAPAPVPGIDDLP